MKKNKMDYIIALIGVFAVIIGIYLMVFYANPQGIMKALPFVCIGLGCGAFGHGMGNVIAQKAAKAHPEIQKQAEIEKNDERNIVINNCAKAKAYDLSTFVFSALLLIMALLSADLKIILISVFAYLFVGGSFVYYLIKFNKEM